MYERALLPQIQSSARSLILLGPRQVGKSTLLQQLKPDVTYNLASPSAIRTYAADPGAFEQEMRRSGPDVKLVLLDEIQRVPQLLDAVQVLLDEHRGRFRFLMSGSSARKLRRGQANLLPGRVHMYYLHPLLQCELGADFDLDRVLAHGTLPSIYTEQDPAVRNRDLKTYVDVYLREEVQAEALVRDIGGYARLLDLVAASSGRILNLSALGRDAAIGFETVRRYFQVLEDTLVVFRIPGWSGSDRSSLILHPKVYMFDTGIRNALLSRPLDVPLADERGLLLEHFVAQELHRRIGTQWPDSRLFHYRTRRGPEVDFVIETHRELWAIEVKASRRVHTDAFEGFASLAQRTSHLKRKTVVFLGDRAQQWEDVEVLPLIDFLSELPR